MAYFTAGDGTSAFLAFAGSLGASEMLAKVLSEFAPHHRVIVPAYVPVSDLTQMLDGVETILVKERLRADVVYGGSFGGMPAQAWVRRHPQEVRRLILSGCGAPDPSRGLQNRNWLMGLPFFPMSILRLAFRFALRKLVREAKRDAVGWRRDYLQLISEMQNQDLQSRYRVAIDFDENCHYTAADLNGWQGKVLILEGGKDRIASPKTRESLRSIYPRAMVHHIPEASHSLLLSHPDEVAGVVRRFIQEP